MSQREIRNAILEYQRKNNVPDWVMCNILCMDEPEWFKFINGRDYTLSTFQQILFIVETSTPLP